MRESLETEGECQAYHRLTLAPTLRSEGKGIAKELTRGLLGGVPHPSSRRGADICVLEGSEARPVSGHRVGKLWLPFSALFIFVRWSFPRKVPCQSSKFGLADPREKGTCPCLCGKPCSEAGEGSSEQLISPCPLDNFLGPLLSLFLQAHQSQLWKACYHSPLSEHGQKSRALQSPVERQRGLG